MGPPRRSWRCGHPHAVSKRRDGFAPGRSTPIGDRSEPRNVALFTPHRNMRGFYLPGAVVESRQRTGRDTTMTQTTPEFAALTERVSHLQSSIDRLTRTVEAMAAQLPAIQVLDNRLHNTDAKVERCFDALERLSDSLTKLGEVTNSNGRVITQHSTKLRIASVTIAASAGLVGWGWNTVDGIHKHMSAMDARLTYVESARNANQITK